MLKHTRSQLEIMGLVVIVILISLGLLFVLQFSVLRTGKSAKSTFTQEQIAANTINAIMLTSTPCGNLDMTDMVKDCADIRGKLISCEHNGVSYGSCEFVKQVVGDILDSTVAAWGKKYDFAVYDLNSPLPEGHVRIFNGQCTGAKDVSPPYAILLNSGTRAFVRLEVCE